MLRDRALYSAELSRYTHSATKAIFYSLFMLTLFTNLPVAYILNSGVNREWRV